MLAKPKGTGFTLIELLIVIAIIGILAAIAYPSYQESVRKGYRADGKKKLMEISQILERCYTQYNSYNDGACSVGDGDAIDSDEERYVVTVTTGATSFSLTATPQFVDDPTNDRCQNYTLNNANVKTSHDNDYCW